MSTLARTHTKVSAISSTVVVVQPARTQLVAARAARRIKCTRRQTTQMRRVQMHGTYTAGVGPRAGGACLRACRRACLYEGQSHHPTGPHALEQIHVDPLKDEPERVGAELNGLEPAHARERACVGAGALRVRRARRRLARQCSGAPAPSGSPPRGSLCTAAPRRQCPASTSCRQPAGGHLACVPAARRPPARRRCAHPHLLPRRGHDRAEHASKRTLADLLQPPESRRSSRCCGIAHRAHLLHPQPFAAKDSATQDQNVKRRSYHVIQRTRNTQCARPPPSWFSRSCSRCSLVRVYVCCLSVAACAWL
jgi:hypothetical protein